VGIYEVYYTLGDAVANARALHEMIRAADLVEIAQWAQTVNIIGAIKTSRTHASMGPVGHFLALYRGRVGGTLVPASLSDEAPLDVVAARDEKMETLALGLINYSPKEDVAVSLDVLGGDDYRTVTGWRITGPGLDAINVPGQPEQVVTTGLREDLSPSRPVVLPRHSITVLEMR
jgi:alpha-N-arabinofuranosidase